MKITDVKLHTLEHPTLTQSRHRLVQVPGLRRIQYTHAGLPSDAPMQQSVLEVETDEGITGRIAPTSINKYQLEILKTHAIGESPFARERLYQMLHKGTRWVYQEPGWFGEFDNCLWDIAGIAAGLPVHALIGRVRQRLPVYLTAGDMDLQGYLDHIEGGRSFGVNAYKLHSYKGGKADIPLLTEVRKAVGDNYALINDPVCSYDLREAIEVGRAMEELDYVWLEEPMHEQKMNQYQELCRTLTIPIMATERLMHDMDLTAQWLIQGATDRLRVRATYWPDTGIETGPLCRTARHQRRVKRPRRSFRSRAFPCRLLHRQHRLLRTARPGHPPAPARRRRGMGPAQRPPDRRRPHRAARRPRLGRNVG